MFCIPKAAVLHGKSVGFALQKSRFRNVKAQLSLFKRIIFTKSRRFLCKTTLYILRIGGRLVKAPTRIIHSFSVYLNPSHKWQNEIRFPKIETLLNPLCPSKTLFTNAYK
ncbi:hypothetical protein BWX40_01805 [Prevotella intermedia]|nr:hypothetical protein BWX40_01805 [Prevotella intermedia]